jgi:hypothetical protein
VEFCCRFYVSGECISLLSVLLMLANAMISPHMLQCLSYNTRCLLPANYEVVSAAKKTTTDFVLVRSPGLYPSEKTF